MKPSKKIGIKKINISSKVFYLKYTKIKDYKELTDAIKFQKGFGEDAS